jgi:apolipoprotein N-acyltransferase
MYKNLLLAIASGLILALAWPTYGLSLLVFIGFVPLLYSEYQIRNSDIKRKKLNTYFIALLTFIVWNSITTWWIWYATAFGAIFAILVNSLLMSTVFLFYHLIAKRKPMRFSLIFLGSFWIVFEKFHHHWDFSWPWLTLGNVFSEQPQWVQWYEFTGIFGGSAWILWVNFIFYAAWINFKEKGEKKIFYKNVVLGISLVVLGIALSMFRYETYKENGTPLTVIALQPNTNPYTEKYHQSHEQIAQELLALAGTKISEDVSFILAPETVFSNRITYNEFVQTTAFQKLTQFQIEYPNAAFLSGIDLFEIFPASTPKTPTANRFRDSDEAWYESYNAAFYLVNGKKMEIYHKSKLVVGVELFPYRSVLEPLMGNSMINLGGSVSTLTPQKIPSVFENPNKKFKAAPIICYESIYGAHVGKYVQQGANFLAIITNDSWWEKTQGHKQLLSYARLRAIEHRRAVARSANSGISAFINQKGDILATLPYETQGALKGTILTNDKLTFYSNYGDFVARIALLIAGIFFLAVMFGKVNRES